MNPVLPLQNMSLADKLRAMEELWADLSRDDSFKTPAWHGEILAARRLQEDSDESRIMDWEEAKKRIDQDK